MLDNPFSLHFLLINFRSSSLHKPSYYPLFHFQYPLTFPYSKGRLLHWEETYDRNLQTPTYFYYIRESPDRDILCLESFVVLNLRTRPSQSRYDFFKEYSVQGTGSKGINDGRDYSGASLKVRWVKFGKNELSPNTDQDE